MKRILVTYYNYFSLIISAVIIGLDQLFKYLAVQYLYPVGTIPLWKGVFQLTYVENRGAAFGIFEGKKILLVGFTGVILLLLLLAVLFKKVTHPVLVTSFALIIGGGIGNLIDRTFLGYVVDYLHLTLFQFPVFNFADCAVVIGTILLIAYFFFWDKKENSEQR
ncbi:MAG: signal peptidase II [Massiliimalia sp.]|jgi:signal peptidase II